MTGLRFVDTNVLLYAASVVPAERSKAEIALGLLECDDLALSVQVLQEFYVQATRAGKRGALSHQQATGLIDAWLRFRIQETTMGLLHAALATRHRYKLSYWDAAIVEAARLLGCAVLLTEDLQHGANFGGVAVMNPFI